MVTLDNRKATYQDYLEGGGDMGILTRSFKWSATALGSPEHWQQSLLTTVNIILESKFPMFLWWGEDLIQFYNDAYRPSLGAEGKHPKALGQKGVECWPEIWPVIKPLIDGVLAGGEATWSEDQLIPIFRNNKLEDVYWTFSYSAVKDETGKPGGVLVNCFETTDKVNSIKTIKKASSDFEESEAKLRFMLADAPVAIGVFAGREMIIESANAKLLEVWNKTSEIIGKPLYIALPELEGQPFLNLLDNVFTSGKPYYGNEVKALIQHQSGLKDTYFNFVYHPLKNAEGKIINTMVVASDVSEQVNARKELEKARDIMNLAISTSGIGVWTAELASGNLTLSKQTRKIYGVPDDVQLSFTEAAQMIPEDNRSKVIANIEQAVNSNNSFNEEYWIQPIDSSKLRYVKSNGKAYYDEHNNPLFLTGTIHDLTEQKEDDLRKNDFIGMVSHELKTPLTSLTALVQMLLAKAKKTEDLFTSGSLERANKQVKKMNAIINGFLNISRLESSKIQIIKTEFDLNELLVDIIEEIKLTMSTHTIRFQPAEPITVFADHDKIVSVFTNLLTNAIKYSPSGGSIEIKCQALEDVAQVSVRDEGLGIRPKDRERLFERYYRVENSSSQHIAGFGLGLYLSAEIIKRHDGKIWMESEANAGSTFYFTLPLGG